MRAQIIKFKSIKEWKGYCFNNHKLYIKNANFTNWIKGKIICIFNYSSLQKEDVKHIKRGIENAIALIGLQFKVQLKNKFHNLNIDNKNGYIIGNQVLKTVTAARKQSNEWQASVFIADKPVKSHDAVLNYGEALTYVPEGVTIFTFSPSERHPSGFLMKRSMHETFHLLGLNVHHEKAKVRGYNQSVSCNMKYNAHSGRLCGKCKRALVSFWKGIEYATKKQFIKG